MKSLLHIFGAALLACACSVSNLTVDTMRPADINIPNHIQRVGVVNRSIASKEAMAGNILEGVLTGEGIGVDRRGSQFCVEGLVSFLNNSPRYEAILVNDPEMKGTGTDAFAPPLPWSKVEEVCKKYNVDALIVLESFDSDNAPSVGKPQRRTRKENDKEIVYFVYPSRLLMTVRSGWRIYDPAKKSFVDENVFTDEKAFTAEGRNADQALANLPSLNAAVKESGFFAGERFGFRVSPTWVSEDRLYFKGKHDQLKRAHEMVKRQNYDAAIEIWKGLVDNPDEKTAGRACYNMALAAEIKGNFDLAIEWATKARNLGIKQAFNYIPTLERRKRDAQRLEIQLN